MLTDMFRHTGMLMMFLLIVSLYVPVWVVGVGATDPKWRFNDVASMEEALLGVFDAERACGEAFNHVVAAESAGADVDGLIVRLKGVLRLLDQAEQEDTSGNSGSASELASQAYQESVEIGEWAQRLRIEASQKALYRKLLVWILANVLVVVTTVAFYKGVKWWEKHRLEKLTEMRVEWG